METFLCRALKTDKSKEEVKNNVLLKQHDISPANG
jgi:hypothetical protein